ncbi:Damage response protein 1 [Fusarium oxysporum f. sp. albedinis]|nr:Damage response protein 1 [Fusarium oxysporum f. sp. albedinis]
MVQRIAAVVTQCIDCFGKIVRAPTNLAPNSPTFGRDMADQQTRCNVWAGNIGAHRNGLSSLDYRLRDSSQIEDQVLSLLKDLIELMQDAHDILMGNEVPWDKINAGDDEDFDGRDTEFNQISVDIADVVNCLLRLSVAIRNPAPHDRFIKASLTREATLRRLPRHFRNTLKMSLVVVSHYPSMRLGTRAQTLEFPKRHMPLRWQISINVESPPLPKESSEGPFECPFCHTIIVANTRSSWNKHVYGDLRPYICLEKDCETPGRELSRRHQWMEHVRQIHWKLYSCPLAGELEFSSPSECIKHVSRSHGGSVTTRNLDTLVYLSQKPVEIKQGIPCPMCAEMMRSTSQYQRHVGRHQEQLALFALPTVESDDKDERVSESDSSAESIDIISNQDEQGNNNIQPEEPPTSYSMLRTDEMTALPPNDPNTNMTNRQNEYFVRRDGIDREVITADICQYLGQDALVRPGHYEVRFNLT